jgi:hypothetical protein
VATVACGHRQDGSVGSSSRTRHVSREEIEARQCRGSALPRTRPGPGGPR